jgi:hypothetical protein
MSLTLPAAPQTDLSDWSDPLSLAVAERDRSTFSMVEEALRQRRVRLAYQPVYPAGNPVRPVFYEGLARILDRTGRPIPARDFIGAIEAHETGRVLDSVSLELGMQTLAANPRSGCRSTCRRAPSVIRAGCGRSRPGWPHTPASVRA